MSFYAHAARSNRDKKSWQRLSMHLTAVASVTSRLAGKIGLAGSGELIGLAHDLGKYSMAFQDYLFGVAGAADMEMEPARGNIDHSTAGAQIIAQRLAADNGGFAAQMLALCVASHHSGLIDCILPSGEDDLQRRLNKKDALSHCNEVLSQMEEEVSHRLKALLCSPAIAAEIETALNRIKQIDGDEVIQPFKQGLLLRMLFSCLIDADRIDTADFDKPKASLFRQHGQYTPWQKLIDRLEHKLAEFSNEKWVDQLRQEISDHCLAASVRPKGAFTLTVPTGGGKTLASLRFALHHAKRWGLDRVVYVNPYTSIADQNAEVVRKVLEPHDCDFASVVLEHHSNLTPGKETWRGSVLAENWDAPIVFTTTVQLLDALFSGGTRSVRRLHALANAVIIFDEAQALPLRMTHMFNNAVNFLVEQCSSSVVLCTATQPLFHRVNPAKGELRVQEDAELMPDAPRLFRDLKRYETFDRSNKPGGWKAEEISDLALHEMQMHGNCLVIVNTKRDALKIYQAWQKSLQGPSVSFDEGCLIHLSTRMCPAHRSKALDEMKQALKIGQKVLCVSTQLIEAGVDIDFASVIRDLAGLDSIAQAAGRCNRNGERPGGRVHIVKMAEPLPKQLNEIKFAQASARRVLDDWRDGQPDVPFPLSDPLQMERFFNHHFFARKDQMDYPVKAQRDDTLLQMLGENGMAVSDSQTKRLGFMQSFASAAKEFRVIDSATQGVIIPFEKRGKDLVAALSAVHDLAIEFRLLKEAQRLAVNVFEWEMDSLIRNKAVYEAQAGTGVFCLREEFYSNEFGLMLDGTERMESMIA